MKRRIECGTPARKRLQRTTQPNSAPNTRSKQRQHDLIELGSDQPAKKHRTAEREATRDAARSTQIRSSERSVTPRRGGARGGGEEHKAGRGVRFDVTHESELDPTPVILDVPSDVPSVLECANLSRCCEEQGATTRVGDGGAVPEGMASPPEEECRGGVTRKSSDDLNKIAQEHYKKSVIIKLQRARRLKRIQDEKEKRRKWSAWVIFKVFVLYPLMLFDAFEIFHHLRCMLLPLPNTLFEVVAAVAFPAAAADATTNAVETTLEWRIMWMGLLWLRYFLVWTDWGAAVCRLSIAPQECEDGQKRYRKSLDHLSQPFEDLARARTLWSRAIWPLGKWSEVCTPSLIVWTILKLDSTHS